MTIATKTKIGMKEAEARIGRCRVTLRRWAREGRMPKPAPLDPSNPRSPLLFNLDEIEAFIREQAARGFLR